MREGRDFALESCHRISSEVSIEDGRNWYRVGFDYPPRRLSQGSVFFHTSYSVLCFDLFVASANPLSLTFSYLGRPVCYNIKSRHFQHVYRKVRIWQRRHVRDQGAIQTVHTIW